MNATAPANLTARQREERALELRLDGWSYRRIGAELGVTAMGAYKAVARVLERTAERTAEAAEEVRALELERLDAALEVATKHLRHTDPAVSLRAVDRIVKIGERRARLLGIDAPGRLDVNLSHLTDAQLERIAAGEDPAAVLASAPPVDASGALLGSTPPPPADDGQDAGEGDEDGDEVELTAAGEAVL